MSNKPRKKTAKNRPVRPLATVTSGQSASGDLLAPWRELGLVSPSPRPPASRTATATAPVETPSAPRTPPATGCAAVTAELNATGTQAVAATYWFDPGPEGPPFSVLIRFTGMRLGVAGRPQPNDRFDRVERVEGILPGSGRIAVTTRAEGVHDGEWRVIATPIAETDPDRVGTPLAARTRARLPRRETTPHTRTAPLAQAPGVRIFLWPGLVGLGVLAGLVVQALLLTRAHVDAPVATGISLGASIIGYVAAKLWYLALHREHPRGFLRAGACIQGFLVGGIGTMALAVALARIPVGTFLDASTPGLYLGMAIGRPGCFFTGCCCGRPTTSRWGLWSSDRRVGVRRVPIQLIEALAALLLGAATLALALAAAPPIPGMLFVGAIAAYTGFRQLLFPFRVDPRTPRGRTITLVCCLAILTADVLLAVAG